MRCLLVVIAAVVCLSGCSLIDDDDDSCEATPTSPCPPPPPLAEVLSQGFDSLMQQPDMFGAACSFSVRRRSSIVLERGSGRFPSGTAADASSVYRIASLTKPITAATVLMLEQQGRLRRTDSASVHLPGLNPRLTIDELIRHAPGLPNYLETSEYNQYRTLPVSAPELLTIVTRQPWDGVYRNTYSNSHYVLLGAVVARVTNTPYETFVTEQVFRRLAMSRSSFGMPLEGPSQFRIQTHPAWAYSAGAAISTAPDLSQFDQALLSGSLGFPGLGAFATGSPFNSAGWYIDRSRNETSFWHGGLLDGYSGFNAIFPSDQSAAVILCNIENPQRLEDFVLRSSAGVRATMLRYQ
jgi:CubicO group peptidase (beta-lactamase class C family)